MDNRDDYQAYLLRLWRDDENAPWRATLQEAHAGQLVSFSSVAQLIAFIEQQTASDQKRLKSDI
ncbi:MAG: hypothetical protein R6X32_09055 [Chloroflexota bacterium]